MSATAPGRVIRPGSFTTGSGRQQVKPCAQCPESGNVQSTAGSAMPWTPNRISHPSDWPKRAGHCFLGSNHIGPSPEPSFCGSRPLRRPTAHKGLPSILAPRACAPCAICPSCQSAARQRACTVGQIKSTVSSIPPRAEGRYGRSSRNVGRGMRWTRRCRVRLRSQGPGHTREQSREAHETSGIVAYGEVVWSWHPLLVLSARGGTFSPTGM
jgi:hypothetical protein